MSATCPGTTLAGFPCSRLAGDDGFCDRHSPTGAAARGRKGGEARADRIREERVELATTLRLETSEDLRTALTAALRIATERGDAATMVAAVRVGIELFKTTDLEAEFATLRDLVLERIPGARAALGRNVQ